MMTTPVLSPQPDDLSSGHLRDQVRVATAEYVTHLLANFAAKLQHDLEVRLDQAEECNAALLLSELCEYWGLSDEQRAQVLGPEAMRYVKLLEADGLTLPETLVALRQLDRRSALIER